MKKPIDLSQIPQNQKQWAQEINEQYQKTNNWWWAMYVIYNLYQSDVYRLNWNRKIFRDKITPICHALAREAKEQKEIMMIIGESFRPPTLKDPENWEILEMENAMLNRDELGDPKKEIYLARA
jgi:hypothetical protein